MKKKYDKRVFHHFKFYNTQELEEYLNDMAQKGYYLLEMNQYQMFFKKDTPLRLNHAIACAQNQQEKYQYKQYCESVGWTLLYGTDKFHVYVTAEVELAFVESDQTQFEAIQRVRTNVMRYAI
ncbi:MAG: DUF2812 domain-containing protein [Lachnotalea sp.]